MFRLNDFDDLPAGDRYFSNVTRSRPSSSRTHRDTTSLNNDIIVISSDSDQDVVSRENPSLKSSSRATGSVNTNVQRKFPQKQQATKRKSETTLQSGSAAFEKRIRLPTFENNVSLPQSRSAHKRDLLSQQINRFCVENLQQDWFLQKKCDLAAALETTLNEGLHLRCTVHIVGSSVNGFGRFNSDCDMCLVVDKNSTTLVQYRVMHILNKVHNLLRHAAFVRNLQLIPAKVRILKFRDCQSGMECDLNVNNLIGLRNTQLMYAYSKQDSRIQPLVLCIKEWAHQNDINDAKTGTLSSYALVLMVIHYLQYGVKPCVVPSLQRIYPSRFNANVPIDEISERARSVPVCESRNTQSLSDLLIGFLNYYSRFNFSQIISIRRGDCFKADDVFSSSPWYRKVIRIEEPFDLSNVARAVQADKMENILRLFRSAARTLGPDSRLRDLIEVRKRVRQSCHDWKRPNY